MRGEDLQTAPVFTHNRDRLLDGAVAEEFFSIVVVQAPSQLAFSPYESRGRQKARTSKIGRGWDRNSYGPTRNCKGAGQDKPRILHGLGQAKG